MLFLPVAWSTLGQALVLTGAVAEGLPYLERAAAVWDAMGLRISVSRYQAMLAEGLLRAGRHDDARRAAQRAVDAAEHSGERGHKGEALLIMASVDETEGPRGAERRFVDARICAETLAMRPLVAHCHLGLGKLYRRTDNREQAQEHFATATTMYREMGMTYWLEKAEAETTDLGR